MNEELDAMYASLGVGRPEDYQEMIEQVEQMNQMEELKKTSAFEHDCLPLLIQHYAAPALLAGDEPRDIALRIKSFLRTLGA